MTRRTDEEEAVAKEEVKLEPPPAPLRSQPSWHMLLIVVGCGYCENTTPEVFCFWSKTYALKIKETDRWLIFYLWTEIYAQHGLNINIILFVMSTN